MAKTRQFNLRLDEEELKSWQESAKSEGLDLSSWIRRRVNSHITEVHPKKTRDRTSGKTGTVAEDVMPPLDLPASERPRWFREHPPNK